MAPDPSMALRKNQMPERLRLRERISHQSTRFRFVASLPDSIAYKFVSRFTLCPAKRSIGRRTKCVYEVRRRIELITSTESPLHRTVEAFGVSYLTALGCHVLTLAVLPLGPELVIIVAVFVGVRMPVLMRVAFTDFGGEDLWINSGTVMIHDRAADVTG